MEKLLCVQTVYQLMSFRQNSLWRPRLISGSLLLLLLMSCGGKSPEHQQLLQELQQLKDEAAIRALADRFSDAANRKDGAAFQALWAKDCTWKIGPPINVAFSGRDSMGVSVERMLGLWDFFVQLTGPGVIQVQGNQAKARFYVNEIARAKADQHGNYNLSMYEDELIKEAGEWRFKTRTYHTIYQDAPEYRGLIQALPNFD